MARVVDTGDAVTAVAPGDLVVVPWSINCGACDHCRAGLTAHCTAVPHMAMYGAPIGGSWGGLFSELVHVPYALPDTEELERQRAAIAALGRELRTLVDASVTTVAPPEVLHRMADEVRRLTGRLTGRRRVRSEIPAVDEFPGGVRVYSPLTGHGTPPRPAHAGDSRRPRRHGPLHVRHRTRRPPGHVHGGMSATLWTS